MNIYPSNIRRCQHIKVNGTLCGSPALRDEKYCYFHLEYREKTLRINTNRRRTAQSITLPVLEDANSIQVGVMQVLRLLLGGQIEHKTAGLALYALQIASSNLARTTFEVSRPTKVVVDRKKVAETPLGLTPWSEAGEGHDFENDKKHEEDGGCAEPLAATLLSAFGFPFPGREKFERRRQEEMARDAGYSSYEEYAKEIERAEKEEAEEEAQENLDAEDSEAEEESDGLSIKACVDDRCASVQ